jgi:hypothetical protein
MALETSTALDGFQPAVNMTAGFDAENTIW